jgi:calcium-translocating P-type ATPase
MLGIALAVSAIPEGLPIAVTVALAAAAQRMARKNVIVRALPAVEGLGACTLIASDKTGTLTMNRLAVERVVLADGTQLDRSTWLDSAARKRLVRLGATAALCNEADLSVGGIPVGDAVDVALLWFAQETGNQLNSLLAVRRLAIIPYEPAQRFAAAEVEIDGTPRVVVKGAPETVLDMCAHTPPGLAARAEQLAGEGYRVLALAEGLEGGGKRRIAEKLQQLNFVGLVGLTDPLRPEVPEAVSKCIHAGIGVRMLTGDHPATALAIARKLGFAETLADVVTGSELAACASNEETFDRRVVAARVFARIEPAQKLAIVRALQGAGEIVAVTGDGVNDGPALLAAHIGVAMGRGGTDVARGAADLVLADDNFASIVDGIEEGRITFSNVRKIVIFLLATGVAEIGMFLIALIAGLPMPLTPVQLLWLNVVTNGIQDVTLGFGSGEGDEMRRMPRRKLTSLVDREGLILMLPGAALMMALAVWLLDSQLATGASVEEARNAVLLMVVLFQNAFLISIRHLHLPLWRVHSENRWLFLGMTVALGLHVGAMHFSPLQAMLDVSPVSSEIVLQCLAGSFAVLFVTEVAKRLHRRWPADRPAAS